MEANKTQNRERKGVRRDQKLKGGGGGGGILRYSEDGTKQRGEDIQRCPSRALRIPLLITSLHPSPRHPQSSPAHRPHLHLLLLLHQSSSGNFDGFANSQTPPTTTMRSHCRHCRFPCRAVTHPSRRSLPNAPTTCLQTGHPGLGDGHDPVAAESCSSFRFKPISGRHRIYTLVWRIWTIINKLSRAGPFLLDHVRFRFVFDFLHKCFCSLMFLVQIKLFANLLNCWPGVAP